MKTKSFLGCIVLVTSLFVACGGDNIKITPDTSSASTGSSSSGTGGFGGQPPGAGGGLSCDPCIEKDGQRIALQTTTITTDDGLHWKSNLGVLYDNLLDISCDAALAEDDVLRCLPLASPGTDAYGNSYAISLLPQQAATPTYIDASCTQRVVEGYLPKCGPNPKYVLEPIGSNTCKGQPLRVSALGQYIASPVAYIKNLSGQCVTKAVTTGEYYMVTSQLPPDTFAAMTKTITP